MIQRVTSADLYELLALEAAAFGSGAWSRAGLAGQLADPGSWLALHRDSQGVGAYIALRLAADEAELLRIATHPARRRHGLAQTLMERGRVWARTQGATRLFLEVSELNHGAMALYTHLGLSPCGRRRGYYGPGDDALLMAQDLVEAP